MGDRFTVADDYLFTVVGWCRVLKVDVGKWLTLNDYTARIATHPVP